MASNSQQNEVKRAREMMQEAMLEEMEAALDWDICRAPAQEVK